MEICKAIKNQEDKLKIVSSINDRVLTFSYNGLTEIVRKEWSGYSVETTYGHRTEHKNATEASQSVVGYLGLPLSEETGVAFVIYDTLLY